MSGNASTARMGSSTISMTYGPPVPSARCARACARHWRGWQPTADERTQRASLPGVELSGRMPATTDVSVWGSTRPVGRKPLGLNHPAELIDRRTWVELRTSAAPTGNLGRTYVANRDSRRPGNEPKDILATGSLY